MNDKIKEHRQIYTAEDKVAFADRDRRISKLSCLDRAVSIFCASSPTRIEFPFEPGTADEITKLADKFVDWVYDVPNKLTDKVDVKDVLPLKSDVIVQPTDVEKKIIYQIAHQLNDKLVERGDKRVVDVKRLVNWVWETFNKYPANVKSIDKILNTSGIELCLIENSFVKDLT